MKRTTTLLALATCTAALALPATASAKTGYCSASGDVCYGVVMKSGKVNLGITLAAKYFSTYRLCVTPPKGSRTCVTAKLKKVSGGAWGSTLRWDTNFPNGGKGTYKAKWYASGSGLGPSVTFKR
jgi:hypothetical protein